MPPRPATRSSPCGRGIRSLLVERDAGRAFVAGRSRAPLVARNRAVTFLRDLGHDTGSVSVQGGTVTVTASDTVDTVLLNLVGIQRFDVEATATSEAVTR